LLNELNHSFGLDIKNSNFPTSIDKFGKKKRKSTNNRNNCDDIRNKPGGQNGHKGNNLKFGWKFDKEIEYRPSFSYVKTSYTHDIAIKEIIN